MCQRYVIPDPMTVEREFLPATAWWKFAPRFNVAAAQYVPAVRLHERRSEGVMLRWGLIPSWLEGQPSGPPRACVQHSRLERSTAAAGPWRHGQRCILPASGFYTWRLTRAGYRQPYFVHLPGRPVFGLAAIWDRWNGDDDDVIESCAIIGVPPNELVAGITAPARPMPAILRRKDYQTWLEGTPEQASVALQAYPSRWMEAYPVSPRINATDVDDPGLIRAVR